MRAPYEPHTGSLAEKAIAHLRSLPRGTWISGADLAEAIGIADSPQPYLQVPIKHGLISKRKDPSNTRLVQFAAGNGVPDPGPPPDEPLEPTEKPQRPVPTSAFDVDRIVARARAGTSTVPEFRAGLFTDGTLVIEAQGQRMVLVADHVAQLRQLVAWSKP